ncbi:MAG TPA: Ig-like domain-containing protein [Anaerolineales bacterium]|nr:Ig-like domain-containing protein [Anaerolineales bacterium]HNQ94693.1 Ig-like domain-containing protein [Anaerolineales bacterium]HNS59689.1 Ig-like domain-containing protein [Anaerolineales bacterium]
MRATGRFAVWVTILTWALASCNAQTPPHGNYFSETGHFVEGEFLRFYNNAANPALLYGFPITSRFTSRDGKTVQYFQRARFELVTDTLGNENVRLTPIGAALHQPIPQLEPQNPSACEMIAGFQVCYDFLTFYKDNGGAEQFGNPVSNAEEQSAIYIQYFENARFEWRAQGTQTRVEISQLGQSYFDRLGEDRSYLIPPQPIDASIAPVISLDARAFVARSITRANDEQTVSVFVQDQNARGVPGANVNFSAQLPDGNAQTFSTLTDSNGVARISFGFTNQQPGELVVIHIRVEAGGKTQQTIVSFRIWY